MNSVPVVSRYQVLIETVGFFGIMYQYYVEISGWNALKHGRGLGVRFLA